MFHTSQTIVSWKTPSSSNHIGNYASHMQLVLRRTFSQSFDAPPPAPPTQTPPSRNSYSKVGAAFLKKQKVYRCGTRWKHLLLLLLKGDSEAKLRLNEETINCKRSKSPTQSLCHADTLCRLTLRHSEIKGALPVSFVRDVNAFVLCVLVTAWVVCLFPVPLFCNCVRLFFLLLSRASQWEALLSAHVDPRSKNNTSHVWPMYVRALMLRDDKASTAFSIVNIP